MPGLAGPVGRQADCLVPALVVRDWRSRDRMTTYQLVPYLVSVRVRGMQQETRPLSDLLGNGTVELAGELASVLHAHRGGLRQEHGEVSSPAQLQVDSVRSGRRALYAVVSPGRSGIESTIRRATGETVDRRFSDHELIGKRHVMYYPANGHRAVLLAERIGGAGAIGPLTKLLKSAWGTRYPETVLTIAPAMAQQALGAALNEQPIKQLVLTRPTAPNGSLMVGGKQTTISTVLKPPRRQRWARKDFAKGTANISTAILSEVASILRPGADPEKAAQAMLDDGWQVAVTLNLPGGTERTINVSSTTAVSMSLQILEGQNEPDHRPTDEEFGNACRKVISDGLLAQWDIHPSSSPACSWDDTEWDSAGSWKAVWNVVQPSPDPSGSVH